jgi:hypothetical protein
MKRFTLFLLITTMAMVIGACGNSTPTEPPLGAEEIQATAVSAAFTIVAETQAAIPTNTPVPPTDTPLPTPLPTDTPVPSPTLDPSVVAATNTTVAQATNSTGGDPCNQPLPGSVSGPETKIKLANLTKGDLVASLYLNKTAFGECGYRGYNVAPKDSIIITDLPVGCYNISVYVNDPKNPSKAFGYGCINNPDLWTFQIYGDKVVLVSP